MLRATAFALAMIGVFTTPAFASGLKAVQTVELATLSTDANGIESVTFAPATDVEPGQQVRYGLAYQNEGAQPAENVSLVMPVPAEVTFLEGSIAGATSAVAFSADGGETYAPREELQIVDGEIERLATAAEITHIKWVFAEPIAAEATGTISFMAVLN